MSQSPKATRGKPRMATPGPQETRTESDHGSRRPIRLDDGSVVDELGRPYVVPGPLGPDADPGCPGII